MSTDKVRITGSRVEVLNRGLRDLAPAMKRIGILLVGRSKEAFTTQRRGGFAWPGRAVPNVPGILRDLERGTNIKARRFQDRPALKDTGALRRSIAWKPMTDHTLVFGLPGAADSIRAYGQRHQLGGTETIRVTATMRANLAKWLRRERKARAKRTRLQQEGRTLSKADPNALGWLFNTPEVEITVPSRPFILVTALEREEINAIVRAHLGIRREV